MARQRTNDDDIGGLARLLVDMVVDMNIKQSTEKEVRRRFGDDKIAGIEYETNTIYLVKKLPHADKVRNLLHELAHYYRNEIKGIDTSIEDEDVTEATAIKWQDKLYGKFDR